MFNGVAAGPSPAGNSGGRRGTGPHGSITAGQTVQATVPTFQDDGWTFQASANEHVTIELDSADPALDPHLYLYGPDDKLVADNDDIDASNNRNSRLDLTLAQAGTYTIRVGKFSDGGAYKLTVTVPQ